MMQYWSSWLVNWTENRLVEQAWNGFPSDRESLYVPSQTVLYCPTESSRPIPCALHFVLTLLTPLSIESTTDENKLSLYARNVFQFSAKPACDRYKQGDKWLTNKFTLFTLLYPKSYRARSFENFSNRNQSNFIVQFQYTNEQAIAVTIRRRSSTYPIEYNSWFGLTFYTLQVLCYFNWIHSIKLVTRDTVAQDIG